MGPIAGAILAALLPTNLLIFGLVCLSSYLCIQLDALRTENEGLRSQPPPTTEGQPAPEQPAPEQQKAPSVEPTEPKLSSRLSDVSNPTWTWDMMHVIGQISGWALDLNYEEASLKDVTWLRQRLEALGYQGVSPEVMVRLLGKKSTMGYAMSHIAISVCLARTSLESEPEFSLLSIPAEVQRDLRTYFKVMQGIKFSPEFSSILAEIPSLVTSRHGGLNKERVEELITHFDALYMPYSNENTTLPNHRYLRSIGWARVRKGLPDVMALQLRMLASPQQLRFRWTETAETYICAEPALIAYAGEDGVSLDEPKLWWNSDTADVAEDGSIRRREDEVLVNIEDEDF